MRVRKVPTKYTLLDAEKQHDKHPGTFWIPESYDRRHLKVGDTVKLLFEPTDPALISERMWVEIIERGITRYVGVLRNDPFNLDIEYGDEVHFKPENVIDIL